MKRSWLIGVILVLGVAVLGLWGCGGGPTTLENVNLTSQQQGIWVSGTGKVSVTPDIATLSLGIEAQAKTVALAQDDANEAMDSVMSTLSGSGVKEKDIQTQFFNIRQVTRWDDETGEQIVTGYRVTNTVSAKLREIEKVGGIIDAVAAAGGDFIRINNIGFSIDEPEAYYQEVRELAVNDAEAKAEDLAELAGVKLGAPIYISEGSPSTPPIRYQDVYLEKAGGAPAPVIETSISAGELDIQLNIQIVYTITV